MSIPTELYLLQGWLFFDTHISGRWCAAGPGKEGHFPQVMFRIGSVLPRPLLETRKLVLWFAHSRNPPAHSLEDTSEFRPRAVSIDFIIRVLSVSHHPCREFAQGQSSPRFQSGAV